MIYNNLDIKIPDYVMYVIKSLHLINKEVYVVGGSLRDYFLNKSPHDWDLVTNESPSKSYNFFITNKNIDITTSGITHGTLKLWIGNNEPIDLTEMGNNPRYCDIPINKLYNPNIYDDISRRDFTMNAMAYSPYEGLIDMHNGLKDIKNRTIRFVDSNPEDRIEGDPFLILRAVRQAISLNCVLDKIAGNAVWDYRRIKLLKNVSGWRRGNELKKIMSVDYESLGQKLYLKMFLEKICHYVLFPEDIFVDVNMGNRYKYMFISNDWRYRVARLLSEYSDECVLKLLKGFEYEFSDITSIMRCRKEISSED